MRKYGRKMRREVIDLICDRCGRSGRNSDQFEMQEFLSYSDTGGYGSVFGDMNRLELDLCQHCVKEVLGQWLRVTSE